MQLPNDNEESVWSSCSYESNLGQFLLIIEILTNFIRGKNVILNFFFNTSDISVRKVCIIILENSLQKESF